MLTTISPGNEALEYIECRLKDDHYRGAESSQHNRYTMEQMVDILQLLNEYAPNKGLMQIRTTDMSKRPHNTPDEITYSQFCNEAKAKVHIGTQDAMRKNLFVDINRMGFIHRYNSKKEIVDPYAGRAVKYVSLTPEGLKIATERNIANQHFLFSKGVDRLLGGYINTLLDILRDPDYKLENVTIYEFMFFITAIDTEFSFTLNTDEAVKKINEYRVLTANQRRAALESLKVSLEPKNYTGNKTNKRDYHNWLNKAQQAFYLLNQTVYFEVRGDQLVIKSKVQGFDALKKLDRSLNEKYLYFVSHKVVKTPGFELHHIVPLSWSESIHHFKMLDRWQNMLYLDGYNHARITQNSNRNVKLSFSNNNVQLTDFHNNKVFLYYPKNVIYNPGKKLDLQDYNDKLMVTIK
jgi:hypothetical protein